MKHMTKRLLSGLMVFGLLSSNLVVLPALAEETTADIDAVIEEMITTAQQNLEATEEIAEIIVEETADEEVEVILEDEIADEDVVVTPEDIILQVGSDETERMVAWYADAEVAGSYARISSNEDMSDATAVTATTTASTNGYYGYAATFTGIEAGTYYYQVACGNTQSEIYSFTADDISEEFNFFVAGDVQIGTSGTESNTAAWQLSLDNGMDMYPSTDMILCVGDQVNTASDEEQYDGFLASEYLRQVPVAVAIGNHDVGSILYSAHYAIPNVSDLGGSTSAGEDGYDFYFVQGNTLFMCLNSNNANYAEHQAFMEDAIAAVPDATWTVVYFHHAPYSAASHADDTQIESIRDAMPPIFTELGIDLVLNGHDHVYTRSYLMDGTSVVETEETPASGDVLVAEEGQVLYITANTASNSKFYSLITNYDTSYSAVKNQENVPNLTNVTVTEDSIVISTYRSNSDMSLVDEVTLTKATPVAPEATVELETAEIDLENNISLFNLNVTSADRVKAIYFTVDAGDTTAVVSVVDEAFGLTQLDDGTYMLAYKEGTTDLYATSQSATLATITVTSETGATVALSSVIVANTEPTVGQEDVTVENGTSSTEDIFALATAKADKLAEIDEALAGYTESDYLPNNWEVLVAIFADGKTTVDGMTQIEDVVAYDVSALTTAADAILDKLTACDLNEDGVVDYSDITCVSVYYGYDLEEMPELSKYDVNGLDGIGSDDYLTIYQVMKGL